MTNVLNATPRFARRTAEMCLSGEWDRDTIITRMGLFDKDYEKEVVGQIEHIQLERLLEEDEE